MERRVPIEAYPLTIELPVLWGQMDAFQHVNNTVYFRYFEAARIAYGDRIAMFKEMQETGIGPILASTNCTFLKPLQYPDTIRVGCRTLWAKANEMEQEYAIFSNRLKKMAAVGSGRLVAYDYRSLQRGQFSAALLDRLLQFDPTPMRSGDSGQGL